MKETNHRNYYKDPEDRRKRAREWKQQHPERVKEYYEATKDRHRDYYREYFRHPDRIERHRANTRRWRSENPDKVRARGLAYRLKYPEKPSMYRRTRIARIKGAPVVESIDIAIVAKRDGWRCHLCGRKVDPKLRHPHPRSKTLDHLVPVSKGGYHTYANIALAHLICNTKRGPGYVPAQMTINFLQEKGGRPE